MPPIVALRPPIQSDLPIFHEHQLDEEACAMAAFPSRELAAFNAHWAKILANPENLIRTVLCDGEVAGNVSSYGPADERMLGYWLGKAFWGQGLATAAVKLFIAEESARPLYAFVATTNPASQRVLLKCGFVVTDELDGSGIDDGVDEIVTVLR